MKLSPPASSSDLEAAREIARRLHQRRRRADRPADDAHGTHVPRPPATPVARFAPPAPRPVPPPAPAAPVAPAPPVAAPFEPAPMPAPPSWDEPGPLPYDPLAAFGLPSPAIEEPILEEPAPEAPVPDVEVEIEETPVSPEEMVGTAEPPPFEELPETEPRAPAPSPFDVDLDETGEEASEMVDAPAPPSWDDIVEACLGHAHAHGAMLIDPAGQVFAARGEWPEPGAEAIAAKLVATMDRTLRDAPTRSISAPLMGRHLTAWRVPLAEGLVTAAFLGDAPVRAEARPAIDTEIHRGAGA
jgi:hypothetical protein